MSLTVTLTVEDFKVAMKAQGYSFVPISLDQFKERWDKALAEHNAGRKQVILVAEGQCVAGAKREELASSAACICKKRGEWRHECPEHGTAASSASS